MSNNEAKFILRAYRPSGRDAGDPAMAEALKQARHDPALGAWFAREQAHDAAVAAKLREVAPPAGLRAAILAGATMSEQKTGAVAGKTRTQAWWRQPVWLAVAAAVAVVLSVLTWKRLTPAGGATLEEFAVNNVDKGFRLQKHSADVAVLKTWLSGQRGPLPEALPAKFAELRALGCRTLDFKGRDVSLLCFERGGKEFHVFVARLEDGWRGTGAGAGESEASGPRFSEEAKSGLVTVTWIDAKNRYVVVSDAGMAALKGLL